MRVVQQGDKWKIKKTCTACKAVLEIEEEDIQYKVTDGDAAKQQYEQDIEGTYFVTCPECGQELIIKSNKIPLGTQERIKS